MKIIIRAIAFANLMALAKYSFADGFLIPCESAPKAAIVDVPALVSGFASVKCTKYGHFLTGSSNDLWSYAGSFAPAMLFADIESGKSKAEPSIVNHAKHFIRIEARKLTQDESKLLLPSSLRRMNSDNEAIEAEEILVVNQDNIAQKAYIFSLNGSKLGYLCNPDCKPNLAFLILKVKSPK